MSLFNKTIGVKFFVDGEDYVKGQQNGSKFSHTFELLRMSDKLKKLFKREKLAIGDVFYDEETELVHVIALQKSIKDIESITKINNIFGYKNLVVNSFSLFKYLGDKEEVLRTQVSLRYIECKKYNLHYCGNIFADYHAVIHHFNEKDFTDGSSSFTISNNIKLIKELNLSNLEKTAVLFYTKDENGKDVKNYCNLTINYNIETLEMVYDTLENYDYNLFINVNDTHHLVQNGYCEFIREEKDLKFTYSYFLIINEYGEVLFINEDGIEMPTELLGSRQKLNLFIDYNCMERVSEKEKFMEKLHQLINSVE